jgi:plasmid stabilization system protein ParE
MAAQQSPLAVIRSPSAIDELHAIWLWNVQRYGVDHADDYLRFLNDGIEDLSRSYARGKMIRTRPDLHYRLIKRRAGGHGHVVVYSFNDQQVFVLHIFHSAQDWQQKLADEPR